MLFILLGYEWKRLSLGRFGSAMDRWIQGPMTHGSGDFMLEAPQPWLPTNPCMNHQEKWRGIFDGSSDLYTVAHAIKKHLMTSCNPIVELFTYLWDPVGTSHNVTFDHKT